MFIFLRFWSKINTAVSHNVVERKSCIAYRIDSRFAFHDM